MFFYHKHRWQTRNCYRNERNFVVVSIWGSFYRMTKRNTRTNAEPELLTSPAFTQLWVSVCWWHRIYMSLRSLRRAQLAFYVTQREIGEKSFSLSNIFHEAGKVIFYVKSLFNEKVWLCWSIQHCVEPWEVESELRSFRRARHLMWLCQWNICEWRIPWRTRRLKCRKVMIDSGFTTRLILAAHHAGSHIDNLCA